MANRQIYQLDAKTLDLTNVIPVQDASGLIEVGKSSLLDLQNIIVKQSVEDAVVEGIDTGTTAVLIYGINVVVTADTYNFCARLPLPVKGKKTTVVNTNTYGLSVRIFPSLPGGKINGVVDGYFEIPADSLPYDFICYENPAPGNWGTTQRQTSTSNIITLNEWTVPHIQGIHDYYVGTDTGYDEGGSGHGGGILGNGSMYLIPDGPTYWRSVDAVAGLTTLRVYTNIVEGDLSGYDSIIPYFVTGYKYLPNGFTYGQRTGAFLYSTIADSNDPPYQTVYGAPVGLLNTPPHIGDTGTYICEMPGYNEPIGLPGTLPVYSRFYYICGIEIPAGAVTKDYSFKFELEYV
jgi:hypothetical protein